MSTELERLELASLEADVEFNLIIGLAINTFDDCADENDVAQIEAMCRLLCRSSRWAKAASVKYNIARREEEQRPKKADASPFRRAQSAAHTQVTAAIQAGNLVRPNLCSECSTVCKPVAHHDSYDRPLDVRWLCRSCHGKHHAKHGPAECSAAG